MVPEAALRAVTLQPAARCDDKAVEGPLPRPWEEHVSFPT